MSRKRTTTSSVWLQSVNLLVNRKRMDWRPVGLSFLVIILHAISAVAHPIAISVSSWRISSVIVCTHLIIFFHTLIMRSSPFCENDRLYKKRNVSFPIFVHCHHSFIKWVHKNSGYQDRAKCVVIMIRGHFVLRQIMHNKAEFVITTWLRISPSRWSGSREVIGLWLKSPRCDAGLTRAQQESGNISAWELTHNCADTLCRLVRFVRPIETRLKMACHN